MMDGLAVHGQAYTSDPEYYGFVGQQRSAVLYDWSIRQWRKVKLQPLATHHDRVTPADPEAQMGEEDWGMEERRALAAPPGEMIARIVGVLQRCGVSRTGDIAAALGRRNTAIQNTLVRRGDLFVRVSGGGKRGVPSTWGLVGVHDKEANNAG